MLAIVAKTMSEAKEIARKRYKKDVNLSSGKKMKAKSSKRIWYRFEWTAIGSKKHDLVKKEDAPLHVDFKYKETVSGTKEREKSRAK